MQLLRLIIISLCLNFIQLNNCIAQLLNKNLVSNYSFEQYNSCPSIHLYRGNIDYSADWYNTRMGSPDYYNKCSTPSIICPTCIYYGIPYAMLDFQYPRTGDAMSGILLWAYAYHKKELVNTREYITGKLLATMSMDSTYCFEMYCNRSYYKSIRSQVHSIGVLFSVYLNYDTLDYLSSYDTIGKTPQISNNTVLIEDTLGWTKIAQEFIATDTFKYFTIGNFEPDATSWFTVYDTSEWINTSYVFIDDVSVYKGKCREEEKPQKTFFNLYPNPGSGVFSLNYGMAQDARLVVYDILGRTVLNETLAADKVLHHFIMQQYSNGMYFLKVLGANNDGELFSQKFLLQR
jgi:hypothetical protein